MAQIHDLGEAKKLKEKQGSGKMEPAYSLIDGFFDLVSAFFGPLRWLLKTLVFWT